MIVDTHVHVWEMPPVAPIGPTAPSFRSLPEEAAPVELLIEDMDANGVDAAVLVQIELVDLGQHLRRPKPPPEFPAAAALDRPDRSAGSVRSVELVQRLDRRTRDARIPLSSRLLFGRRDTHFAAVPSGVA